MRLLTRTLGENISIELALSPNVWPVQIDRAQFEAIANLATNARCDAACGGALAIATSNGRLDEAYAAAHADVTAGQDVVVEVSDSGTGMPADILTRIFEPFFTTKEQGRHWPWALDGAWLHEAIGRPHHQYSEPDNGTTFRLHSPKVPETVTAQERSGSRRVRRHGGNETVLVVEDNAGLRRIVVRQLSEAGYRGSWRRSMPRRR